MRGGEVRAGRREGLGCGGVAHKRHARGKGPTQGLGAKGTRGAHLEHAVHVRDAGGVEAQRLVEGRRELPSRREGMRCGGERCEPEGGRAWGVVAAHKRHAREWPDSRLGGHGHARGAHAEHVAHGRDAGGVEAQRLVEGLRVLPSRRGGHAMRGGEVRTGRREGLWCGGGTQAACTGKRPDSRLGGQGHARSARRTCRPCQ